MLLARVASYPEREVAKGRPIRGVLEDPYLKNRLDGEAAADLSSPRVIDAVSASVTEAIKAADEGLG